MTDNGSCYQSKMFRAACKHLGLRHIFTRPYTPKTNGKAERFIQTALREWAYARAYHNSDQRLVELPQAPSLQLASATWELESQHTNQSSRSIRGQPVEAPQLAGLVWSDFSRGGQRW